MTFEGFGRKPESDVSGPDAAASLALERSSDDAQTTESQDTGDGDLVARVAGGDDAAFEVLVQRHERAVIGYLVGVLGDRDEALDAAQECFLRLCTRADRYLPTGSFRAWLFRIATNVAIDAIRSRKRRFFGWTRRQKPQAEPPRPASRGLAASDLTLIADPRGHALDDMLEREREGMVRRAVQALPPKYRAALVLRDIQELSYEETADALGIAVGTVKSRVNRARNLLRDRLAAQAGGPA